jgi:carbamoyltransferase
MYENIAAGLVTHYLYPILKQTGRLVFAGTSSMNVKLVERLHALPAVKHLFVHPGCGDAGTAIGAASYAAASAGHKITPLKNMFLGPRFTKMQCISACRNHRERPQWEELKNAPQRAAELLQEGHLVAWFQGRMEFGNRALGNRSILANPTKFQINDKLNNEVKHRERWRPFCPSLLDSFADEFLDTKACELQFMTLSVPVREQWREKLPSVIYKDGTARVQVVTHDANPRFYQLLKFMEEKTGYGLVINTTLNRPGEAMICTPEDAVEMFIGSDLSYLIMEDILVTKRAERETW